MFWNVFKHKCKCLILLLKQMCTSGKNNFNTSHLWFSFVLAVWIINEFEKFIPSTPALVIHNSCCLKMGSACLFCFYFFLVGVTNQHSWGTDWSQVGNLEMLIGSRALYSDHVLLRMYSFQLEFNGKGLNYGFGWPGRSVPPDIDSDKLRNELHS